MASARCVFCGESISETDAAVGRAPHAAHAACADAALADDAHWNAVAAASGVSEEEGPTGEAGGQSTGPRRGIGCATIAVPVVLFAAGLRRMTFKPSRDR